VFRPYRNHQQFVYENWVTWYSLVCITGAQLGRSMVGLPPCSWPNLSVYLRRLQSWLLLLFALPCSLCYALNQATSEIVDIFTHNPGQGPLEDTDSQVSWDLDIFLRFTPPPLPFLTRLGAGFGRVKSYATGCAKFGGGVCLILSNIRETSLPKNKKIVVIKIKYSVWICHLLMYTI
jgi:hypothetical protein